MITDERGPIGLAGVMGGADTEIADPRPRRVRPTSSSRPRTSTPISIARTARRHKLSLRGVPPLRARRRPASRRPPPPQRTVDLLVLPRGRHRRGRRHRGRRAVRAAHHHDAAPTTRTGSRASTTAARPSYAASRRSAATSTGSDELIVTVPSWRPDLADPNDLAEEVIRLEGYENLPSTLPQAARRAAA